MIDPKDMDACRILVNDIQALESRAHRLGLQVAGHTLNRAKNAVGWEMAGDVVQAGLAANSTRA